MLVFNYAWTLFCFVMLVMLEFKYLREKNCVETKMMMVTNQDRCHNEHLRVFQPGCFSTRWQVFRESAINTYHITTY